MKVVKIIEAHMVVMFINGTPENGYYVKCVGREPILIEELSDVISYVDRYLKENDSESKLENLDNSEE